MPPRGSLRCLWVGLPWWGEDTSGSHRGTWFLAQQHPDKCPKDIQFTCLRLLLEIKKPLHEQRMRYYFSILAAKQGLRSRYVLFLQSERCMNP